MGNIIDFNEYRERNDIDYAINMVNNQQPKVRIHREEAKRFKKANGLNTIKYAGIGTLFVLGEVICSIGIGYSIYTNTLDNYHMISLASVMGFIISPLGLYAYKKEILDAYQSLCYKFKEHKKRMSKEELDIFEEELRDIKEREYLRQQGFTVFDKSSKRR